MSQLSHRPPSNGTGGNITYSIDTFEEGEIEVFVNGVKKTNGGSGLHDYTIPDYTATGGTITWNTSGSNSAPDNTFKIHVRRRTKILNNGGNAVEGKATYSSGSAVKATDLNNNTKQVLRAIQERHDQPISRQDLEDGEVTRSKIEADAIDGTKIADDAVDSEHLAADSIDTEHYAPGSVDATAIGSNAVTTVKILNDNVTMEKLGSGALPTDITVNSDNIVNGSIQTADIGTNQITNALIADDQIDSEHYVDGSIDHQHLSNDCIDSDNIQDNAINSEHYVDGSIDRSHLAADIVDGTKIADDAIGAEHIQANAVTDSEIATGTLDNRYYTEAELDGGQLNNLYYTETELNNGQLNNLYYTETELNNGQLNNLYYTETELNNGALDARYYTEQEAEDRFLRQDSTENINSGMTWSNSDSFVATTAAINARIIDLIDEVGGFTAIDSEQHFPNENPQGATGQAAILSIQAASGTLTPSGTTLTIVNGNVANNANITITGVPSAIPSGFGFLVESTSTLHTYTFHRLVPKATEVTTVANNITNIVAAGANVVDINNFADLYQISANAPSQRADGSSLAEGDLWFDTSNDNVKVYDGSAFAAVTPTQQVLADIAIVSGAITFSEDLGLITDAVTTGSSNGSLDIVADVLEDEITFTTTVVNSGGNKYVLDGDTSNPAKALTLYKGWTYTFDLSDSSNSGHPLVFKTDSGSYTTDVTVTGTAGNAGAKVSIKIPESQPTGFRYYCSVHGNAMGNTITVKDDPLKTVSDDITKVQTVADNINNLNTVEGISANVTTVAGIASNVTAVAGNATNINAVAADATDIGAVAGKATEIGRLGTADAVADLAILGTNAIVSDMDTLADISSNITTVAGISGNVTTVAGIASNVTAVAGNASNINSAVSNASNINSAVSNASNINAAVANASNITAVAGNATNINAVAADATDIGAVAAKATEIGRLGTADAVADLAILGTTDVVADMNTLATSAIVSDMDTLADISSNITTVAGISANVTTVAGIASNVTAVAGNASNINSAVSNASNINAAVSNASNINSVVSNATNINTVASNVADVNTFANRYRIGSSNPTTSLDVGDLFFNTSANELRVYNGTQWQGGVTATGNLSQISGSVFTGDNRYNDNIKAKFGTDSDLQIFHDTNDSVINASGAGNLKLQDQGNTKLEITSTGISATGNIVVSGTVDGRDVATDGTKLDGIEASATADQTAAEIRTLVGSASDSNVFTDALLSKLNGIEASATADQTASEIVALISGQTIAPNVITTTNLTLDFGSIA